MSLSFFNKMRAEEKARIEAEKRNAEILVDPDKPFERKEEVAVEIEVKEEVPQTENIEEVKVEEKTEEKKTDAEKIGRGRKKGS